MRESLYLNDLGVGNEVAKKKRSGSDAAHLSHYNQLAEGMAVHRSNKRKGVKI